MTNNGAQKGAGISFEKDENHTHQEHGQHPVEGRSKQKLPTLINKNQPEMRNMG
jgi:hypothetical protein